MEGKSSVDVVRMVIQWGVVPLIAFVFMIHKQQQNHNTEIEVLKALNKASKETTDRQFAEMDRNFHAVMEKLNGIETYLRK